MKIVVTGGAGFIGSNLCKRLTEEHAGHDIVAYDNLSSGLRTNLHGLCGVELREADILDRVALDEALTGADAVVHLAARANVPRSLTDPLASHHANATGTLEVLEAARRASRDIHVLVASSSSVYGASPILPKCEDHVPAPLSPYAASKLAAESYARAYGHSFGMPVLVFRFFNVFGPLQPANHAYAAVVPAFLSAALAGDAVTVHGDGEQTRDFTFVDSVTDVLVSAVFRRVTSPGPVNLAFGTRTSLNELLALIGQHLGGGVARRHLEVRAGDVRDSQADCTRFRELFPDVRPVTLSIGLQRTLEWFRASTSGRPVASPERA